MHADTTLLFCFAHCSVQPGFLNPENSLLFSKKIFCQEENFPPG